MKYFRCVLLFGFCCLLLSGCSYERLEPSFKSEDTFVDGNMQAAPNFAQLKELPMPEKTTMDLKKTMLFGNEPLIGRLAISTPYSQSNLFDFYMQEMPKFGWREITVIRAENSFMTFAKDNRIATIRLSTTAVSGSDVIFDISFGKSVQSGY